MLPDRAPARRAVAHEPYIVMCEICTPQTDLQDG